VIGLEHEATICNSLGITNAAERATFYTTGMEHSPTSATGTAWERTPWRATRRAAGDALNDTRQTA
jgi:hypothetical protein